MPPRAARSFEDLVDLDRIAEPLHRHRLELAPLHRFLDLIPGLLGDEDLLGRRLAADPRREIDLFADERVFHAVLRADPTAHGDTGVDADAAVEARQSPRDAA